MRILLAVLFLVPVLTLASCKTPNGASAVKSGESEDGIVGGEVSLDAIFNSQWHGEYVGGSYAAKADLAVETDGSGTLTLSVNDDAEVASFSSVRYASNAEIAQYRQKVAKTAPDAQGNIITLEQFVSFVGAGDALITLMPILHPNELYLSPMGSLTRKADGGDQAEAETIKCGGIAGLKCPSLFKCALNALHLDSMGSCVKSTAQSSPPTPAPDGSASEVGKKCGGFAGIQCSSGYSCSYKNHYLDGMGRCAEGGAAPTTPAPAAPVATHGLDTKCGGFAGIQCDSGFKCISSSTPDGMGKCAVDNSPPPAPSANSGGTPNGLGAKCGGFAGLKCASGFSCSSNANTGDGMGKCVVATTPVPTGGVTAGGNSGPERCGGFAGLKCTAPKVCKMLPPHLDGMGNCVTPN